MRNLLIIVLSVVMSSAAAAGYVCEFSSACVDDAITITIWLQEINPPSDHAGVLIHRETLGDCDSDLVLNPEAPLPLPSDLGSLTHVVTDPVIVGQGYRYWAVLVDDEGNEEPFGFWQTTLSVDGCGQWPVTRGVLVEALSPELAIFEPCDCWFGAYVVDLTAIDEAVWLPLVGQMVELTGVVNFDEMPGSADVFAETVVPVSECVDPVAVRSRSWSTVKSLYAR